MCAYSQGAVPGWWLIAHRRLKAGLRRHGLRVRVELAPFPALPDDIGLLVVPRDLEREARETGVAEVVAISQERYADVVAELVERLSDPKRYQIERAGAEESTPNVVKYVGYERVE